MNEKRYSIRVEVESRYLADQSEPQSDRYAFAYKIRITNMGNVPSQLISRHWLISDETGRIIEVKGLGVVGRQPLLAAGESFEYTSGSQIGSPAGSMRGSYFFVAEDGHRFEVPIEEFALAMPRMLH